MKYNRVARQLPNMITLLNMLLGITVLFIHICHQGESYRLTACALILIAALLDTADGKLARWLNAESALGKQLDSFADFVSFGIAPAAILLTYPAIRNQGWGMYACLILYAMAGAFRLARFNIGDYKDYFVGLPITAAGFLLMLLNLLLHYSMALQYAIAAPLVAALVCLLTALMVCNLKIKRIHLPKPHAGKTA